MMKRRLFNNLPLKGKLLGLFLFCCYFNTAKSQLYIKDSANIIIKGKAIIHEANRAKEINDDTLKIQSESPNIIYVARGVIISGISEYNNIQIVIVEDRSAVIKNKKETVVKKTVSTENYSRAQNQDNNISKLILRYKSDSLYFKASLLYSAISLSAQNGKNDKTEQSFWFSLQYCIALFLIIFSIQGYIWCNTYESASNKTRPPPQHYSINLK